MSGGRPMLSGFIEATIELTGGERKADCCGVAATIHVVGRGQDGFVGADGKANFGFRLGPDAYDATLTLTYGPYTAGFCQPERRRGQDQREVPVVRRCRRPLERPRRVRDLDDQVLHQERGQGREGARGPGVQDDRVDLEVAGAPAARSGARDACRRPSLVSGLSPPRAGRPRTRAARVAG